MGVGVATGVGDVVERVVLYVVGDPRVKLKIINKRLGLCILRSGEVSGKTQVVDEISQAYPH